MDSSSPPEKDATELAEVIQLPQRQESPKDPNLFEVYYSVREKFPVINLHSSARLANIDGTVTLPKELITRFMMIQAQYDQVHKEVLSWVNSSRLERGRTPLPSS